MIIAVYTDSKKKTTKLLADIKKLLSQKGKKAETLTIALQNAPKHSKNPYINSIYDTNSRYNYRHILKKYSYSKDFIIISGLAIDTIIRESNLIHGKHNFSDYVNWLNTIEQTSYDLPTADINFIDTNNQSTIDLAKDVNKLPIYSGNIFTNTNLKKIINKIESHKPITKNDTLNIYQCLKLRAQGKDINFDIKNSLKANLANKDLTKLRKKYIQNNNITDYGSFISLPLTCQTNIGATTNVPKMHSNSIDKVTEAIATDQFYPTEELNVNSAFPNEIQLVSYLGQIYNANLGNLNINKRRRFLEAVIDNIKVSNLSNIPFYRLSVKLSYYDLLLISNIINLKAQWEIPGAKYGYVDVGDNPGSDLLEEMFDQTNFIINSDQNSIAESILLLGHLNYFYVNLDIYNTIIFIKKGSMLKGSQQLNFLLAKLTQDFSERFPIIYETIIS
jgi:hypothetical protein